MARKKNQSYILHDVRIEAGAAEGKALARHEGKVIFVPFGAPGDVADLLVQKQKKSYAQASIVELKTASPERRQPDCPHFGICGGCKWQHLEYNAQLQMKESQVRNDIARIGKTEAREFLPILASGQHLHYRNKLEFTFSNKAWEKEFDKNNPGRIPALGFHIPGMFDKVLDIETCKLAPLDADIIRTAVKKHALRNRLPFYDIRQQSGYLRNLMLRSNSENEWMLVLVIGDNDQKPAEKMFDELIPELKMVKEWCIVSNTKKNDTWSDLQVNTYKGKGYLTEKMEHLTFRIRPQSFFQTNYIQALELYRTARAFAGLTGKEIVYDLYSGTGTIALFLAPDAAHVTGVEYVAAAVEDARENAVLNQIRNAAFVAGDMKAVLNEELFSKYGFPDVVITDPPRDGMHPDVVARLLEISPDRIVYVSCNPATLARDLALLQPVYNLDKIRPVDMFPQTHHVECVALLQKKI